MSAGADEIIARRLEGDYTSLEDFLKRVDVRLISEIGVVSLVKAGAFDAFGLRRDLLKVVQKFFS